MANPDQPFGTPPDFRYRRGKTTSGNCAMDQGGHSMDHRALPSGDVQRLHQGVGQHRHPVSRAFAVPDKNLAPRNLDILDAKANALHEPQPRAVEQRRHEPVRAFQIGKHGLDLCARQHHGQARRLPARQMGQKCLNFGRAHFPGMPFAAEKDEAPNPVDVAPFRANAAMLKTNPLPDFVKQLRCLYSMATVLPVQVTCSNTSSLATPVHQGKWAHVIRH